MSDNLRLASVQIIVALLCFAGAASVQAQVRGISYTVAPIGEQVFFGDNAGLNRAFVYGGKAGFGFGRFVELDFIYLRGGGLTTDFSRVTGISQETRDRLADLSPREVDLQRYGGTLKLNLPTEPVLPFVLLGAGIIRFAPEHLNETRTIYLGGGGGVQFAVAGRYALAFSVHRFSYRYNLGSTFFDDLDLTDVGLGPQSFNQTQINNWALRAGLQVYVGGRSPGEETELDRALREQLSGGFRGLSLRIEPSVSSLAFHDDLGFRSDQRFLGVYAGLNLGPYLGVRGFYWRGLQGEGFDFQKLQAYGGELRFELGAGPSLSPFLSAGGGYMDVLEGYAGRDGSAPGDEPFVLVGAGAVLPINEALSLNAAARSVLMGEEGVHNVDDPGQVRASWMYSAGLNFAFGERAEGTIRGVEPQAAALRAELRESEARLDSLAQELRNIQRGESADGGVARAAEDDTTAAPATSAREPRLVTLPLPEEGELYVRFGSPGGVSIESISGDGQSIESFSGATLTPEQIEDVVRQTVREQLGDADRTDVTAAQVDRIEEMLIDRLDAMEERLQNQLEGELRRIEEAPDQRTPVVVEPSPAAATPQARYQAGVRSVRLFTGVHVGAPNMGIVGIRLDVGPNVLGPLSLQPEFALGLGAETYAYHLGVDAVYALPIVERMASGFEPYAGLGLGTLGFNEAPADRPGIQMTLNARVGADFNLPWGRLFAEYATYNLFTYDRMVVGYRLSL